MSGYVRNASGENQKETSEKLVIRQKTTDMMLYAYPVLSQYPKSEKFSLCADIKHVMDQMLELIITAEKKYFKKTTLQDLDIEIAKLKAYIRLSYDMKFISGHTYEVWSGKVVEIGKMLGGWMKAVAQKPT